MGFYEAGIVLGHKKTYQKIKGSRVVEK